MYQVTPIGWVDSGPRGAAELKPEHPPQAGNHHWRSDFAYRRPRG
jgi:hypothetical protein